MSKKKIVSIVLGLMLLSGCQTMESRYGQGELYLGEETQSEIKKYLAIMSMPENKGRNSVFMINKVTGKYIYGSGGRHISNVVDRLSKDCGDGCEIFAIKRNIVWKDFPRKAEFEKLKNKINQYVSAEVNYYSEDAGFEISYKQKNGIGVLARKGTYHKATAISSDGRSYASYQMDFSWGPRKQYLERLVHTACLAMSEGEPCYVYSYDSQVYN